MKLTDAELLAFTGNLKSLTPDDRKRRTRLKDAERRKSPEGKAAKAARARAKSRRDTAVLVREGKKKDVYGQCIHIVTSGSRKGKRCDKPCLPGSNNCATHQPRLSFKKLKAPEMMREAVEAAVAEFLRPYFAAAGLEFKGFDAVSGEIIIKRLPGRAGQGICIHGESKDGYINMTNHPDLAAQVAIMEKLMDRVYGKARQTTVLEGGARPVQVQPVRSADRARNVADLLARSHALPSDPPHEGRQRRQPGSEASTTVSEGS